MRWLTGALEVVGIWFAASLLIVAVRVTVVALRGRYRRARRAWHVRRAWARMWAETPAQGPWDAPVPPEVSAMWDRECRALWALPARTPDHERTDQ